MIKEMSEVPLFGTAGGYIGICVGFSFLHLPLLIRLILHAIRNWIVEKSGGNMKNNLGTKEAEDNLQDIRVDSVFKEV